MSFMERVLWECGAGAQIYEKAVEWIEQPSLHEGWLIENTLLQLMRL